MKKQQQILNSELASVNIDGDSSIYSEKLKLFHELVTDSMKAIMRDHEEMQREIKKVFEYFGEQDSKLTADEILLILFKFLHELDVSKIFNHRKFKDS